MRFSRRKFLKGLITSSSLLGMSFKTYSNTMVLRDSFPPELIIENIFKSMTIEFRNIKDT